MSSHTTSALPDSPESSPVVTILGGKTCLGLALLFLAQAQEVPYGVGEWPEALGNHRARIRIEQPAEAAWIHLPWRRRDAEPDRVDVIVMDAATNQRVPNVLRVRVQREAGDLLFQPPTAPGEYFVYYLPYKTEGSWYFPTTIYLAPTNTANAAWMQDGKALADRILTGDTAGLPAARVLEFQAINDFHRFDPMEVVASPHEVEALLAQHPGRPYFLFPETRDHPIRMTDELPLRWVQNGPGGRFEAEACRGEFYVFQVGLHASRQALEEVAVDFEDLVSPSGARIKAAALRCFNLTGTNWLGTPLRKTVSVAPGRVQPLWIGLAVPPDAPAATFVGTLTLRARNVPASQLALTVRVKDELLTDGGDAEIGRLSRLRWLDSTIGLDDEAFPPYPPITRREGGRELAVLGRTVRLDDTGLLSSITSTFTRNVDGLDAPPRELLARPMRLEVVAGSATNGNWRGSGPSLVREAPGAVAWVATNARRDFDWACEGRLECDGYLNFRMTLQARQAAHVDDIRLEIPLRREVARYLMGMGRKGGLRPARWEWKWDASRSNNQLWLGDVNAGLSCKLKHVEDRWDLYNLNESGPYRDWDNQGRGGCVVEETGAEEVVVRAFTGARDVAAGEELHFNFGLQVTPVKTLDPAHWEWRYFHRGSAAPVAEAAAAGATLINLHQGDSLNPYINYPFLTTERLSAYAREAHQRNLKVKLYYTIRELSNYAPEFWALRSLDGEVYSRGAGFRLADQFADKPATRGRPTGSAWLCEHAITDYVPAWHQPLGNGHYDASVATTGLSRWHNYYLEGLNWLIRNVGIDGLYLDGVGYDREIMKRVRKVMQRARPGCLIDFHSGNNFHPEYGLNNCANQYLELFPYLDSLWFGEGFDYNETPDYWLVEIAGIPYGLFGEMLHGGGNPWRGMLYGMTCRFGWSGDPRGVWKLWDEFGIAHSRMVGYWDPECPVRTGREDVLATAYQRSGQTLVAIASWAAGPTSLPLTIDFERLGLNPATTHLYAPRIAGFQGEALFKPGDPIPIAPGRGWLLWLDEKSREIPAAADLLAGRRMLMEESFAGETLGTAWSAVLSTQPGTSARLADGSLCISAVANAAAFVERALPPGVGIVTGRINMQDDSGASWGPGLALVWPDGRTLRVNLRAEGRFGIDDGSRQLLEGMYQPNTWTDLALELDASEVVVRAAQAQQPWQELARFPRGEFPGDPRVVRIGKMSPGSKNEDFSTPGPAGKCLVGKVRVLGESQPARPEIRPAQTGNAPGGEPR